MSTATPHLLDWFNGLADPTRLRLLRILERHELGVLELCDVLQMPQSTVSRHLKVLADQGWVVVRREGTGHYYRMILDELDAAARRLWVLSREQTEDWLQCRQDRMRLDRLLRQKQSDSQAFFAGAAGEWDRLRREFYGDRFAVDAMLSLLPDDWVVADLGCGTGYLTAELAGRVARVIGVDNSPAMLNAARGRCEGMRGVDLRQGDLAALPIEDGQCNAAMLLLVLSYVVEPAAVLAEAARILTAGGRLVIVDLLPHDREDFRRRMGQRAAGFDLEWMARQMERAGLSQVGVSTLPPAPEAKGPALFLATGKRVSRKKLQEAAGAADSSSDSSQTPH